MKSKIIVKFLSYLLKIILILMFFIAIIKNDLLWAFFASIMIFISFMPDIIRKYSKINLLYLFDIFIILSLLFHTGNGLYDFCKIYPVYNKFTHFFSAMVVAFIVLVFLPVLDEKLSKNREKLVFDIIVTTIALGVVWEFLEWSADNLFGLQTQLGLNDTMGDLFADTLGGISIAIIGWFLVKTKAFKKMIKDIKKEID